MTRFKLHFEITVNYTQMDAAIDFVRTLPEVPMVLDHCGKPGVRHGQLDLFRLAQPRAVFYPIGYDDAAKLLTPGLSLPDIVTPATLSVHLWHSALTDRGTGKLKAPAAGSFFAREIERLGVSV